MANWLQRVASQLDFWDTKGNQKQRQQFAKEDEDEKKKRQQQARVQASRPQNFVDQPANNNVNDSPSDPFSLKPNVPKPTEPLMKVGSQSGYAAEAKPKTPAVFTPGQGPLKAYQADQPPAPPKPKPAAMPTTPAVNPLSADPLLLKKAPVVAPQKTPLPKVLNKVQFGRLNPDEQSDYVSKLKDAADRNKLDMGDKESATTRIAAENALRDTEGQKFSLGQLGKDLLGGVAGAVTAPFKSVINTAQQVSRRNDLEKLAREGKLSVADYNRNLEDIYSGSIDTKVEKTKGQSKTRGANPLEFGKKFTGEGLDFALNTVAGPSGKGVGLTKQAVAEALKLGSIYGVGQNVADVANDKEVTPGSVATNLITGGIFGGLGHLLPNSLKKAESRPADKIQTAIEKANNKGDMEQVKVLIDQLPEDLKTPMKSALGLEDTAKPKYVFNPKTRTFVKTETPTPAPGKAATAKPPEVGKPLVDEDPYDLIPRDVGESTTTTSSNAPNKVTPADPPPVEVSPGVKSSNLSKASLSEPNVSQLATEPNLKPEVAPAPGQAAGQINPPPITVGAQSIPDPTSPMALVKADGSTSANEPIMAEASKFINAPLKKAEQKTVATNADVTPTVEPTATDLAEAAKKGDVRIATKVDAQGNAGLVSDTEAARELAKKDVVPQRQDSAVAATEADMQAKAVKATQDELKLANAPAPKTRERVINTMDDEALRTDLIQSAPVKERVVLGETDTKAKAVVNDASDETLVAAYSNPQKFETPDDLFQGLAAARRLQGVDTAEARTAISNITDAISEQSSKSGLWQRASQILFEDMPTPMKVDYLMTKLSKAGVDMSDADRSMLAALIERSDSAMTKARQLEDEARSILDSGSINNASMQPGMRQKISEMAQEIQTATREKELRSGEAWRFWQEQLPKSPLGKRFGDVGRTLMLSSPSGRVFDVLSTTATSADDLLTRGVSNLIGKGVNLVKGRGTVQDTISNPRQLVKGLKEGVTRIKESFQGKDHVTDFLGESKRATRGDINTGGGPARRTVRTLVEAPTNLTKGLETEQLFREGMQEAAQQGLRGEARKTYATLRAAVPSKSQLHDAVETHMRANMLHDNGISRVLTNMANALDKKGGGWAAPFIRNQVAPFTSWLGGNLHRTFTDKNVLWNVTSAINQARKGNTQGVIDDISKLAINTGEAYAAGALLTQAGILTTTDANGDDYAGLYFHIGDRYIPVAAAGTVSVPIILGNALQQGINGKENFAKDFTNALTFNTLKNAGVASVFGGDNNLQSSVLGLAKGQADAADTMGKYVGDFVRQYIPAVTGDVNAMLDYTGLNPTGEAAQTKKTYLNPETNREKTDVIGTELAKTQGRIPFAAQNLDRETSRPAKDILDRATKGTHDTLKTVETREKTMTALEKKAADKAAKEQRKSDDIPDTQDAIQARVENGDYDSALKGMEQTLHDMESNKDVPKSKREKVETDIKRLQVTKGGQYDPGIIPLYKSVSVTEWRNMGNPDHADYDPDLFELLKEYDGKMAEAGVSRDKDTKRPKYFEKAGKTGSGRGGRGGGGKGGGSGKEAKFITDIATLNAGGDSFSPIKAQSATFGAPQSSIPVLQKVPNNDRSKLKKISVTRGGRA